MRARTYILPLLVAALGCRQFGDDATRRSDRADGADEEIVVGVVWAADDDDGFVQGVELATKQINAAGGVYGGRKLKLQIADDKNDVAAGKRVAQDLAEDLDVVAVIGHHDDAVARVTSIIYEYANIVMMFPATTSTQLTRDGFHRLFRSPPSDQEFGRRLADLAAAQSLERFALLYENNYHGRAIANAFEGRSEEHRIRIVDRLAYAEPSSRTVERQIEAMSLQEIDGVVLSAPPDHAAVLLDRMRQAGVDAAILGGPRLDSPATCRIDKKLTKRLIVPSPFAPELPGDRVAKFVADFEAAHKTKPSVLAAQGYDAVVVLAEAMKVAESSVPETVSRTLRRPEGFEAVTGAHKFDGRGSSVDRPVIYKKIGKSCFQVMAAEKPAAKDEAPVE